MNYLIIIFTVLPIFLLIFLFYKKDTLKESKKLLQKLFFSGFLSALLVIIISFIGILFFPQFTDLENANIITIFMYSFVFVALCEEFCKWIMIYKIAYNHKEFDQFYDIVLYSVLVGLGFACFENFLYVLGNEFALYTALFRAITAIPAHACFGVLMGYFLGLSKFNKEKQKKYFNLSIIIPTILHGTYDFLILSGIEVLNYLFFGFTLILFITTILRTNKIVKIDRNNLNKDICPNCNILITNKYCPNCGHKK